MRRYVTSGMRGVSAESMADAAKVFAQRLARKSYGSRGYALRPVGGSYTEDGRLVEYSAFVGYSTGRNETTGKNVHFTVREL